MASTLELRRFLPNNFDTLNPNPSFRNRASDGSPDDWTVVTGTYTQAYENPYISDTDPKVETTVNVDAVKSVTVRGRSNGSATIKVYEWDGSTETTKATASVTGSADNYFVAGLTFSVVTAGNELRIHIDDGSTADLYEVCLFEETLQFDPIFDNTTGDETDSTFIASNMNLMQSWEDDSGDLLYDDDGNSIRLLSTSYNIPALPTFTGSFDVLKDVKAYFDYDPDGDATNNFDATNNTRLLFYELNRSLGKDSDAFPGVFTEHCPKAMDLEDFNGAGSNSTSFVGSDDTSGGNEVSALTQKNVQSTISGDTIDDMDSANKHTLSRGSDLTTDDAGFILGTDTFPQNALNPICMQLQTKDPINDVSVHVTLNFEWVESG